MTSIESPEPKDSASSSPDERTHKWLRCPCGHPQHSMKCRVGGTLNFCGCLFLTPAADIAATCRRSGGCADHPAEPERIDPDCIRSTGCRDKLKRGCAHGCAEAADEVTRLGEEMEPEAPEERPCPSCGQRAGDWFDRSVCAEPCGSAHNRCANCGAVTGDACLNEAPKAPRRTGLVVEYTLTDGRRYEIALPGDAEIRVAASGALVVTHTERVAALTRIRPMDTE